MNFKEAVDRARADWKFSPREAEQAQEQGVSYSVEEESSPEPHSGRRERRPTRSIRAQPGEIRGGSRRRPGTEIVPYRESVADDSGSILGDVVKMYVGGVVRAVAQTGAQTLHMLPRGDEKGEEWIAKPFLDFEEDYQEEVIRWGRRQYSPQNLRERGMGAVGNYLGSGNPRVIEGLIAQRQADTETPPDKNERNLVHQYKTVAEERGSEQANQWLLENISARCDQAIRNNAKPLIYPEELKILEKMSEKEITVLRQGGLSSLWSALWAGGGFKPTMLAGGWQLRFKPEGDETKVVLTIGGEDNTLTGKVDKLLIDTTLPDTVETFTTKNTRWGRFWSRVGRGGAVASGKIGFEREEAGKEEEKTVDVPVPDTRAATQVVKRAKGLRETMGKRKKYLQDELRKHPPSPTAVGRKIAEELLELPRHQVIQRLAQSNEEIIIEEPVQETAGTNAQNDDVVDASWVREVPADEQTSPDTEPSAPSGWWSEPDTIY